ncbi:MAG TPA: hypothetical protein VGM82_11015 [Gemmatimonadaceae bacterium]|jgi:hypothetical protein
MHRRVLRRLPRLFIVAGAFACAPLGFACASHKTEAGAAETHDRLLLDSIEIVGHGFGNTAVAITNLRPEWLQAVPGPSTQRDNGRGNTGMSARFPTAAQVERATGGGSNTIAVFLEGSKQQLGLAYLNSLPVEQVALLRNLRPPEAMATYGPEWAWGAIIVRLRQP